MSAINEREISLIRDEDVLKKMWQDTEDFGRKKEIRSHMYKLREARLKDLYCNSDVKDIQISSNTKTSFNQSTHADSLADHSFASLKSKEIRDSESPTRDVSYRITGSGANQGWNVSKIDERSQDGKTHRIVQSAQTSGTEVIPKGKLDFEAKSKQEVVSFQDGDDKNFTKSQGTSSNTFVRQEAVGGDDHSSFKTSSTKSSSSSRTVTEQSYGDTVDRSVQRKQLPSTEENVINKTTKVYTTDAPRELKSHPGYVEGQTKVTRETRTLSDGTVVTTTKYETTGANEVKSSSSNQYSSSSTTRQDNRSKTTSSTSVHDENYSSQRNLENRRNIPNERSQPQSRYYVEKTHTIPNTTENVYQNVQSSRNTNIQEQKFGHVEQTHDSKISTTKNTNEGYEIIISGDVTNDKTDRTNTQNLDRKTIRQTNYQDDLRRENIDVNQRQQNINKNVVTTEKVHHKTTTNQDVNSVPLGTPIEIEIDVSRNINNEKIDRKTSTVTETHNQRTTKPKEVPAYDIPHPREPIRPAESELKTKTKPTDGQYDTTYRTDYTNKRISVDVSPTHEAFARSLRAVSPDRLSSRSSSRNLKTSNTSLRSSSSPEKSIGDYRRPSRLSPDRHHSPTKKTPDRFSSSETITYRSPSRPGSQRNSPEKSYKTKRTDGTYITTSYTTDTTTRKQKTTDDNTNVSTTINSSRRSPTKTPSQPKPSDNGYYNNVRETTTDLDDDVSVISHTTITKTEQNRPSTLDYSTRKTKKVTERSPSSPLSENISKEPLKKDRPADRPLKRTDTYEERCRQILGITNNVTTERRRSSLEKLKRRGSATSTQIDIVSKSSPAQKPTDNKPSTNNDRPREQSPRQKSPSKQGSPIQEFPAQIRRSPEKSSPERKGYQEPTRSSERRHSTDKPVIQEFPSQIRRTPEKPQSNSPSREYPKKSERKSPIKDSLYTVNGDITVSEIRTTQTSSRNDTNKLVTQCSNDKFDRPKGQDYPSPKESHPGKSISPRSKEHIYEEISETRTTVASDNRVHPHHETPKKIPKTSIPRGTSPLKEFPSQTRNVPETDEPRITFVTEERVTKEVVYDVPRKSPETDEYTRKTTEDETSEISITEVTRRDENGPVKPKGQYPKYSPDNAPRNNYPDQRYPKKASVDISETIFTTDTTSITKSYDDSSSTMKFEPDDYLRPTSPQENVEITKQRPSDISSVYRKPVPKEIDSPNETSRGPIRQPTKKSSLVIETNETESTENISNKNWTISKETSERTPQNKQVPGPKKNQPEYENYPDQNKKTKDSQPSEQKKYFSKNVEVNKTDVIYANGHVKVDKKIPQTDKPTKHHVVEKICDDSVSEDELLHTTTTVTLRTDQKIHHNEPLPQELDNVRNREPKDFGRKGQPKDKIPEQSYLQKDLKDIDKPQNKLYPKTSDDSFPSKKPQQKKEVPKKPDEKQNPRKELPKYPKESEDSSDEEIEELQTKKHIEETYEGRTPAEEPLVIKKCVSLLYSDDEDDKKKTQILIESEITDRQTIVNNKKPKAEKTPKTTTSKFIFNEKQEINVKSTQSPTKFSPQQAPKPNKKPLVEKNQNKPKISGQTEYIDQYNRKVPNVKDDNKRPNTLSDIENFENQIEDNTVHIRTHRVDDTINKRKTAVSKVDIDQKTSKVIPKKPIASRPSPNESPKATRQIPRTQVAPVDKTSQKLPKYHEPSKLSPKPTKPSTPQKHVAPTPQKHTVSTTITLKPKSDIKTTKTKSTSRISTSTSRKIQSKPTPKKIVKDEEESDDESIPDSLNESITDSVNNLVIEEFKIEERTTKKTPNKTFGSNERKTPSRTQSKPELIEDKPKTPKPKLEKRCISTKSIIISNTDKGVTVDLQRSISSREPTPDRVCPLPVTSDDDGLTPRYPDKIVEPDDGSSKKKHKRLFDTAIHENEEGKVTQKITEVTDDNIVQRVTDVDKVDRDDDSLLTVNKKINKFLTTAEKLTEKSIVDISQPAPKVERPKFVVGEDLKEDDCLLSVSDKVNKFITEAEHMTSQNTTQHRKSVNIDVKSDVSKKVNQFTSPQETKPDLASPRKPSLDRTDKEVSLFTITDKTTKFIPEQSKYPDQKKPVSLSKLDASTIQQDVFITTECSQIEKEEDLFRTSKRPSKPSFIPGENPERTIGRSPSPEKDFKPYHSRDTKSPKREFIPTTPVRKDSTETTKVTRKDSKNLIETETTIITRKDSKNLIETREEVECETPRNKTLPRNDSFKEFTPKNRRPSQEEKIILSSVGRLRSSESIKKAKAVFENTETTKREERRQKDILNRPSVFEGRNKSSKVSSVKKTIDRSNVTPKRLDFSSDDKCLIREDSKTRITHGKPPTPQSPEKYSPNDFRSLPKSPRERSSPEKDIPGYMKPLDRSVRPESPHRENVHSPEPHDYKIPDESSVPEEELPGYMRPLDRSSRPHSPKRDVPISAKPSEPSGTPTKFGVTLKRTDSNKGITYTTTTDTTTKKHPIFSKKNITEEDIEQIYELDVLEELLLKLTGYELRRKIRTQIRIVKKLITENKLEITIQNIRNKTHTVNHSVETSPKTTKNIDYQEKYTRRTSPPRKPTDNKLYDHTDIVDDKTTRTTESTEYQNTYTRKTSTPRKPTDNKVYDHTDLNGDRGDRTSKTTEYKNTYTRKTSPPRKPTDNKIYDHTDVVGDKTTKTTEYQNTYTRKTSPQRKPTDNKLYTHTDINNRKYSETKTEYSSTYTRKESSSSITRSESPSSRGSKSPDRRSPDRKSPGRKSPSRTVKDQTQEKLYQTNKKNDRPENTTTKTTTTTTNLFKSSLKKTDPKARPPSVPNGQPEWVTQRNLKKVNSSEGVRKTNVSSVSSNTVKKQTIRASSPVKEVKSTDIITSSYGVGPTDENGAPLFGLRALRAQNKDVKTKVQGSVISSHYYSETGKEPVGQISVTKYSSDPRDLGSNDDEEEGILSITTTQKFGFDDAPSLKQLTNTEKEICDVQTGKRTNKSKSSTMTRRNSVKALTQKFVENAVEVSKNERQSSYPKAGLILRSSSFKNDSLSDEADDYTEISAEKLVQESVSMTSSNTRVVSGGTFLKNKSKVTGVQDAITRMKTEDLEDGDTPEDIEARGLLNKYLGSQVILSGIEGHVTKTSTATARATSSSTSVKNTTTVTTVIVENGKEVTKTRVFEHPISDGVLETVWDEQTLRYLLDQSEDYEERKRIRARLRLIMAEQEACTELVKQASQDQSGQSIDGESLLLPLLQGLLDAPENEQTHDSGTESGEDQRSGLIAEVQNALLKLSASLQSDSTDITSERRSSLLQLVTKLQAGLSSATSDRRQVRFNRRRERPDRHTIGVSSEELANARKLMEEISCPSQSSSRTSLIPKQNSESNVNLYTNSQASMNPVQLKSTVKNSTPKPFSCSNSASVSSTSSSVQTPSESLDCIGYLFNDEHKECPSLTHSPISPIAYDNSNIPQKITPDLYSTNQSLEYNRNGIPKYGGNIGDSEEDDSSTIKTLDNYPKPDLIMQNNPIYHQPDIDKPLNDKTNRFTSKKLKLRRANTIDIPKPLHFYECDDDEETDYEDEERRRRNNYLALRGPIRVGNMANRNSMPVLEPKTENDKKFLAFINKRNENNRKHSIWANNADKSSNWNNKFDHLKTNFEKPKDNTSARNFWESTNDSVRFGHGSSKYDPKISKQSARNLKQMFEEKQKQAYANNDQHNVVTGSIKFPPNVEPERSFRIIPQPLPVNKFSHAASSAFQPINKGLQEVEKKIKPPPLEISKTVLNVNDSQGSNHLFLYSPKPLQDKNSVSPTSPSYVKPWVGNSGESRVLALAAKKFENPIPPSTNSFQPRRLSREKISIMPNFQENTAEKLTAPYLVKSLDQKSNTVRKLSGQYDNIGSQTNKFERAPQPPRIPENRKHIEGFQAKFTVPQNYAIRYDKPKREPQPQKNVLSRFPSEEHQTTPSDIKKYNQIHHNERVNVSNPVLPNSFQTYSKTQEAKRQEPYYHQPPTNSYYMKSQNTQGPSAVTSHNKPQYPASILTVQEKQQISTLPKYEAQAQVTTQIFSEPLVQTPNESKTEPSKPKYNSQTSLESLKEYDAINSRVMSGPVAQVASTVRQKSPMTRNEHDMEAAFNLKNVLQKVSNSPSPNPQPQATSPNVTKEKTTNKSQSMHTHSSRPFDSKSIPSNESSRQSYPPKSYHPHQLEDPGRSRLVLKSFPPVSESCEITAKGEHIVTGKFSIPSINVKSPDVHPNKPTYNQILSKCDSWNQICLLNQGSAQPSARSPPNSRGLMKSKSTHAMIAPKQFEAGMTKDEIIEKKRTLEAFFGGGSSSQPTSKSPTGGKVVKRAINRTKTSDKNVQYRQMQSTVMPSGLARSRTLPDIVCPDLLDESNVDKAFDDLFSSS